MKRYDILVKIAIPVAIIFVFMSIILRVLVDATKIGFEYSFPQFRLVDWVRELLRILWVSGGIERMFWKIMLGLSLVGGVKIFVLLLKNKNQIKIFSSKQSN